jgi:hypothetical protein
MLRGQFGAPLSASQKQPGPNVPVIPQLALRLDEHRIRSGKPATGPIFKNSIGGPLDLNACYQREMKDVLKRAAISWHVRGQ